MALFTTSGPLDQSEALRELRLGRATRWTSLAVSTSKRSKPEPAQAEGPRRAGGPKEKARWRAGHIASRRLPTG